MSDLERPTHFSTPGPAGTIDCAIDWPEGTPQGWALLLHPNPVQGGTRDNKVVTTLARACRQAGLVALRPNFRGVGESGGTFDHGAGETDDMAALVPAFAARFPELEQGRFALAGFSFGSAVASRLQSRLARTPDVMIVVGTAVQRFTVETVPSQTLVVHGEEDDVVPLAGVLDWARPQGLPVVVVPGTGHFFHGRLVVLRQLALQQLLLPRPQ